MSEQNSKDRDTISIVVPCYNEQEALPFFHAAVSEVLNEIDCFYDLIYVDDGSSDGTLVYLEQLAESDPHVTYISFSRNFGKEAAMYAGLRNAQGDFVAIMDADMQDPPSLLSEMYDILKNGRDGQRYDSVATRRQSRVGEPLVRSWFSRRFYSLINRLSDAEIMDGARDFRLMRKSMVDATVSMGEYNRFTKGIFGWVGFKTYWLPFENVERVAGETKWSFRKLVKYALNGIVSFSEVPLSVASWLGIILTVFALLFGIHIVCRKVFLGNPVDGWASMACIILFVGGMQCLCIGVIGQYLAKVFLETKHRPIYIVSTTNRDTIR